MPNWSEKTCYKLWRKAFGAELVVAVVEVVRRSLGLGCD